MIEAFSAFTSVFLGIFIEAVPYLLLGTLASGLVEEFFSQEDLAAWIPRSPLAGALLGSLLGLIFPVCECGVVPLVRRLYRKGVPLSVGIAFLLAAPVINPIVIASTYTAFGLSFVFWGRLGLTLLIAFVTGLVFSLLPQAGLALRPESEAADIDLPRQTVQTKPGLKGRLGRMLLVASDEFFEMGRYLIIGSLLAAFLQTAVPQQWLTALGRGPFISVLIMILLAVLLSVCSTVDAFIALAFMSSFSSGSLLAFLVFGPMVDIKSILMFLGVFKRRTVLYLTLLPLMMVILASVLINYLGLG
jgi:uncharacterized membrane protein YraQ (UPF0718 family)